MYSSLAVKTTSESLDALNKRREKKSKRKKERERADTQGKGKNRKRSAEADLLTSDWRVLVMRMRARQACVVGASEKRGKKEGKREGRPRRNERKKKENGDEKFVKQAREKGREG
jgi:hypothetical protein